MTLPRKKFQKGIVMIEIILAVGIAGIVITGIGIAMQQISKLSFDAKRQDAINRIIYNELTTIATRPRIVEGQLPSKRNEQWDIEVITVVTPLEDVANEDGVIINNLFKVEVTATYWENTEYVTITAETWRNSSLYAR